MNEFEKTRLEKALEAALAEEQSIEMVAQKLVELGVRAPVLCGQCQSWSPHNPGSVMGTCFCRGFMRGIERRRDGYCDRGCERSNGIGN